jgi:dihydroorotate dehydrogenase electron transfer subunit
LVTSSLARRLEDEPYRRLYTCGPMQMMAAVARLCARHGVEGEAALETAMGCGYGACLGCAVPHAEGGFAMCCTDGPVFALQEVRW